MPADTRTPEQKLREQRLALQREIGDQLRAQQRVYDEGLFPNSADAKLLTAAVRGQHGERALSPAIAKLMEGNESATSRFEIARAEIERITKLVTSKRNALAKVERELDQLRSRRTDLVVTLDVAGWGGRVIDHFDAAWL